MKSINCGNIRREIESAGSAEFFSSAVVSHIRDCAGCADVSRRQHELHSIVSNLGTVAAPGDFDFRLRARLAEVDKSRRASFSLTSLSWGFRSVAVAAMLLVVAGLIFLNFRSQPVTSPVAVQKPISQPATPQKGITRPTEAVQDIAQVPKTTEGDRVSKAGSSNSPSKRRGFNSELATTRGSNRSASRDFSSTSAGVVRPFDQVAGGYPTEAFPINASYQSLKVSVDNGSGSPRTISLPSVSFGSQRALSQSATPLMASARGTW